MTDERGKEFPPERRSACADASLAAELARLDAMTIEERIKEALTLGDRISWLRPAPLPER